MVVPQDDVARVADAHQRLVRAIAHLDDDHVRRASHLPGWTVGHVLTHVARNADSNARRAHAAERGRSIDQYEGGSAGRLQEIEGGSGRTAAELVDDVRRSALALDETWRRLSPGAWGHRTRDVGGQDRPLFELPSRRWQEVEVHLLDLGVGLTPADWPDDFVLQWLPRTRERMWAQLPPEAADARFDTPADELAWLYGRLRRAELPDPPPWG